MDRSYPPTSYVFPHKITLSVHKFSEWDKFETWMILQGNLTLDLITYYFLCSAFGFMSGLWIGNQIIAPLVL